MTGVHPFHELIIKQAIDPTRYCPELPAVAAPAPRTFGLRAALGSVAGRIGLLVSARASRGAPDCCPAPSV